MTNEDIVVGLIMLKTTELVAKGYSIVQADAAVKRARGWAAQMSSKLSSSIREQAYIDFFRSSLDDSEIWLSSMRKSMAGV